MCKLANPRTVTCITSVGGGGGGGGGGGEGGGGATPKSAPADKLPVLYLAFIFVADFVVESVVSFFARGLRGMKRALSSKDRGRVVYNILLIGETG